MEREPLSPPLKPPVSLFEDYLTPYQYGGKAAFAGVTVMVLGLITMLVWDLMLGGIVVGFGALLLVTGFILTRRNE